MGKRFQNKLCAILFYCGVGDRLGNSFHKLNLWCWSSLCFAFDTQADNSKLMVDMVCASTFQLNVAHKQYDGPNDASGVCTHNEIVLYWKMVFIRVYVYKNIYCINFNWSLINQESSFYIKNIHTVIMAHQTGCETSSIGCLSHSLSLSLSLSPLYMTWNEGCSAKYTNKIECYYTIHLKWGQVMGPSVSSFPFG